MYTKRLYDLREDSDTTQMAMGKVCGVSRVAISQWENGKEVIPLRKLNAYANHFNVSIDYIFGLTNIKSYNSPKIEISKYEIGKRLKIFRKLKKITQKDLAEFLNTTHSTISGYESGRTLILTAFVYEIATNYNISADWLCGRIN